MWLSKDFHDLIDKSGECWLWLGSARGPAGYGQYKLEGKNWYAHRLSYIEHVGPVHDGLLVLHRCDNPRCVNPDHLFLGTQADNVRDRESKGRGADWKGEKNNAAKLTQEQVARIRLLSPGYSQRRLAGMFGVSQATVSKVVNRKLWP